MTADDRALPTGPKAILMGGGLDGRVVRLAPDDGAGPPVELTMLVPNPGGARAYAVAGDALQPAVAADPVTYVRVTDDLPTSEKIYLYVPKRGRRTP